MFSKASQFLKAHERLLIFVLAVLVFCFGYMKVLDYMAVRDARDATAAQIALQAQIDSNKMIAQAVQQTRQDYEGLRIEFEQRNRSLEIAQANRATATKAQQQVDQTLQPEELAARWITLVKVGAIQPTSIGYQVTAAAAVETVVQLEELPGLRQDLADTRQIVVNKDAQIVGLNGVVGSLTHQVDGLNIQIVKQTTASNEEITLIKSQARKSKMKWFLGGFVVGAVARGAVKIFTGF